MKFTLRTDTKGALIYLASILGINLQTFIDFAEEDDIGGCLTGASPRMVVGKGWPDGSIIGEEGKLLYACVRAIKPETIVECGSFVGCSTNHLAKAVALNGVGHLWAIDHAVTPEIPEHLKQYVTFLKYNRLDGIRKVMETAKSIDFLFEDSAHYAGETQETLMLALPFLSVLGIVFVHDTETPMWSETVPVDMGNVVGDYVSLMIEKEFGGMGFWRKEP